MKDLKRRLAVQGLRADDVEIFSATMQIERVFHVEQSAIHPTNRARAAQCFIWIMFHVEHAQEQQQYHPIYLTPMRTNADAQSTTPPRSTVAGQSAPQ